MRPLVLKLSKLIIILGLIFLGLFTYWRMIVLPESGGVPVLSYHKISTDPDEMSITPERFTAQLKELRRAGYYTLHLSELADIWDRGERPAPGALVITFDDGYQNNLSNAQPILAEQRYKATVFIIVNRLLQWDLLDWDEVRQLSAEGWEIGVHTWSHIDLTARPDYHGPLEVVQAKQEIARRIKGPVKWIAYPFGAWNYQVAEWVKKGGYQGAVTGRIGLGDPTDGREIGFYNLDRIPVIPSRLPAPLDIRLRIFRAEVYEFSRWLFR